MTKSEHIRLQTIINDANELMNAPPTVNPKVRDADVVDAILADIAEVMRGREPSSLIELIRIDTQQ